MNTQITGDGEAHPYLSHGENFADHANWDVGALDITQRKPPELLAAWYTRAALKQRAGAAEEI